MSTPPKPHQPVMVSEIVSIFGSAPEGVFVDATLGGGGHSKAVLESRPDFSLVGIDRDSCALSRARESLSPYGDRASFLHANFEQMEAELEKLGISEISAILFDLGASRQQLTSPERGFSFRSSGPLDMRMDQSLKITAETIVNSWTEKDLQNLFWKHSDEKNSSRIAKAITAARPIKDTETLAMVIKDSIPVRFRSRSRHPATKVFMALRIAVNEELSAIAPGINQAITRLKAKGKGAVLSYHSKEDKIVKNTLRVAETGGCECPPKLPCGCGAKPLVRNSKPKRPSFAEKNSNRSSRSAVCRFFEKVAA